MNGRDDHTIYEDECEWEPGDRIWLGIALIILSGCVAGGTLYAVVTVIQSIRESL